MARILVVEDDNEVASYFVEALRVVGHEAERAATPYGAAQRIVHNTYDLVMMDLALRNSPISADPLKPKQEEVFQINGILLAAAIRWFGYKGPIIIVTGGTIRVDRDMVDLAQITGTLLKPVLPRDMISEITRHLG